MAVFKKYVKKKVVVAAKQVQAPGDYGVLGNLISGDWILNLANGNLVTMDNTNFQDKYILTNETEEIQGTDWD